MRWFARTWLGGLLWGVSKWKRLMDSENIKMTKNLQNIESEISPFKRKKVKAGIQVLNVTICQYKHLKVAVVQFVLYNTTQRK